MPTDYQISDLPQLPAWEELTDDDLIEVEGIGPHGEAVPLSLTLGQLKQFCLED